jgi:hypothetical protein
MESDADRFDRDELVQKLWPAVERLSGKPESLRQLQHAWLVKFHDKLMEFGWRRDQLRLDIPTASIWCMDNEQERIIFAQIVADQAAQSSFKIWRDDLPTQLRVHDLHLNQVGALATLDLHAYAGFAEAESDDFLTLPYLGIKLESWSFAACKAMGFDFNTSQPKHASDPSEASRWQAMLLPLAHDILGCGFDPRVGVNVVLGEMPQTNADPIQQSINMALNGLIILHEIGHFESGHGQRCRRYRRQQATPPAEVRHSMESEADDFAIIHMKNHLGEGATASTAMILFALFALSPELLDQYPFCPSTDTHPHPLHRLCWALRLIYPHDVQQQLRYFNTGVEILTMALGAADYDTKHWHEGIHYAAFRTSAAPHLESLE